MPDRVRAGREASPSVKTTEAGGPRGYDAGKKIEGRKPGEHGRAGGVQNAICIARQCRVVGGFAQSRRARRRAMAQAGCRLQLYARARTIK
jgi:hypothetical protein